jgi:glutaminase
MSPLRNLDYQPLLDEILAEVSAVADTGVVADYIPELGSVDPRKLGIHLATVDGRHFQAGDAGERFSIQSISKVLTLAMAIELEGDALLQRVGVEPSGSPFNSLVQLEYEQGIPRNPFINAGAIVVCDVLVSRLADPRAELLSLVRRLAGAADIDYNARVAGSEKSSGYRNRALVNLMKDFGNIVSDADAVLDFYFTSCAIEMSCRELAQAFLPLAADGVDPRTGDRIVDTSRSKRINAVLQTCGFYDEAGEFSFRVGLPGKSGVGGGIIAVHPGHYSVAVWSPGLNARGNSSRGMQMLELLTTKTRSSIF